MAKPSKLVIPSSLIISVGEARKLLGNEADNMTDYEIAESIGELMELGLLLLNSSFLTNRKV